MSENTQNLYAPLPPVEKQSTRFFVDDPDVGWKPVGQHRWFDIANGKIRVPKMAGKTFRSAYALVEIDGRKVVALCRVYLSHWKIGNDGFADPDDQMRPTAQYTNMEVRPGDHAKTIPTKEDVEAIKRCLGISSA